ncbi:MAG: YjgP/YjgQ family permease [Bacteroidetes bacterium]|nr:YjgP/YjgQ family permease [Bacteroidota bacterium]
MKKLDRLIVTSFIPPFIATFFIAIFVLMMQTLWVYIDDIAGKGVGFFILIELIGYMLMSLIPMALPIAILISSVMVLGNLAERYELSSIKSAGVPLLRTMRPLIFICIGISIFSFYCANNLIPVSNLKFKSRLYDIQRQKPTLNLEQGVFNDDFQGFAIRIGKKHSNGRAIEDVLIYDHTGTGQGQFSQIVARNGEMYTTADRNYFVMNLFDGNQYIETRSSANKNTYPFIRTSFKQWTKIFDLSEFDLNRTDEELFKSHRSMLTSKQLSDAIDTISLKIQIRKDELTEHVDSYFILLEEDAEEPDTIVYEEIPADIKDEMEPIGSLYVDSLIRKHEVRSKESARQHVSKTRVRYGKPLQQKLDKPIDELSSLTETFTTKQLRSLYSSAKTYTRSIYNQAKSAVRALDRLSEEKVKHIYDYYMKYSMALVCLIFLFIGAPMGAIVRKGGFGYPILIAIIFFMLFIVLTIFCKKIAESFVVPAVVASWIPCGVLAPIGVILTYRAMKDSKMLNIDRLVAPIRKLFSKKKE